jgi:hypothetical protein
MPAVVFILCEKESPALRKAAKKWKATVLRDPLASLAYALGRGPTLVVASDEIRSRALASGADEAIAPDAKEKDLSTALERATLRATGRTVRELALRGDWTEMGGVLDLLAGATAHTVNNQLVSAHFALDFVKEMLRRSPDDPEIPVAVDEALERIDAIAKQMALLRNVSRLVRERPRIDVVATVREAIEVLTERRYVPIKAPPSAFVNIEPADLTFALGAIVSRITRLDREKQWRLRVTIAKRKGTVSITIHHGEKLSAPASGQATLLRTSQTTIRHAMGELEEGKRWFRIVLPKAADRGGSRA